MRRLKLIEQKQETRYYLLKDVTAAISSAAHELERVDFMSGRIRSDRDVSTSAVDAVVRVEVRLKMVIMY